MGELDQFYILINKNALSFTKAVNEVYLFNQFVKTLYK